MSDTLVNNASKDFNYIIDQIDSRIESQLDIINSTIFFFMSNPIIRQYLQSEEHNIENQAQAMKKIEIEKQLSYLLTYSYLWDYKLIKSVYIFEDRYTYYSVGQGSLPLSTSLQRNLKVYKSISLEDEDIIIIPPSQDDPTIYFAKNMKSIYSLKYIGTIIFAIDVDSLSGVYSSISQYKNSIAFLVDSNNNILLHTDPNMLGKKNVNQFDISSPAQLKEVNINNNIYFVTSKVIEKYGLTSVVEVPKNQIISNISKNILSYSSIVIIILFIFIGLTIVLSAKVNKPIKDLMKNIEKMRNGNFTTKMPSYNDYYLNRLSDIYNRMTDEIQYLINDVYKKQLLLKEAELKSLQSQINPHFLFNVLDTISWHARAAGNQEIINILTPLSRLLRANINMSNREKTSIREEMEYVMFYLSIQKGRFDDRFEYEINIDNNDIMDYFIPKLCVQTAVENAVIHGLEEKTENGKLTINFHQNYNTVLIEIIDNGVGFDVDKLDLDRSYDASSVAEKHESIGLYNSNKRIKLLYGEEYGIKVESRINAGTKVTICVPVDKNAK